MLVIGPYLRMRRGAAEAQTDDHALRDSLRDFEARLDEAAGLARAIDLEVVDSLIAQINEIRPATYLGKGKVDEIAGLVTAEQAELVVMDCALSPIQQRNLEKAWNTKVLDRIAQREQDEIIIDVVDNGIGLPKVARQRLLEPYVTTRAKGTGLGLAIVGRVLEDHGGRIELKDASDFRAAQRGAWMRLRFAVSGHAAKADAQAGDTKQPPAGQTADAAQTTNSDTKTADTTNQDTRTEAATGN